MLTEFRVMNDFAMVINPSVSIDSVEMMPNTFAKERRDDWDSAALFNDFLDYSEISEVDQTIVGTLVGEDEDAQNIFL